MRSRAPVLLCLLLAAPAPARDDPRPDDDRWVEVRCQPGAGSFPAFSRGGDRLAVGGGGEIRVWGVPDGKEQIRMQLPDKLAVRTAFADDGKHLVSAGDDGKVRHWSLATGKQVNEVDLPRAKDVQWVAGFSPGGRLVAVKVTDGVYLADTATGKVTAEVDGACPGNPTFYKCHVAFSHDGKRLAAGAGKGRVGVWDVATGKPLAASPGHDFGGRESEFMFVAFSPDDRYLATAGFDVGMEVRVWDPATAERLAELKVNSSFTTGLAWTPDGTAVATNGDFAAAAFDVATGKAVEKFEPFGRGRFNANAAGTTPDNRYVVFTAYSSPTDADRNPNGFSVYLCRMPAPKPPAPLKPQLTAAELDGLWADVTSPNRIRQRQIVAALGAAPGSAVPFLAKRVPPAGAADVAALRKLVAALDADDPATRKAAQEALAAAAHRFEALLREELAAAPAGEVRNRLTFLLGGVKDQPPPADLRAELRAVELLAGLGTDDARKALADVAAGAGASRVTGAAKAALSKPPGKP